MSYNVILFGLVWDVLVGYYCKDWYSKASLRGLDNTASQAS